MREEIKELINKAERSHKAASQLFEEGYLDFAVSGAYEILSFIGCVFLHLNRDA